MEAQLKEVEGQMAALGREGEEAVKEYLALRTQVCLCVWWGGVGG